MSPTTGLGWRDRAEVAFNEPHRLTQTFVLAAESAEPMDTLLAAKPGHLALRVVAVALLGLPDRLLMGHLTS